MVDTEQLLEAPAVRARALTYGGLGLALVLLIGQIALPTLATAEPAMVDPDPAGLLPPMPDLSVAPVMSAPVALFELTLAYPSDGDIGRLLVQAGAKQDEAEQAAAILHSEYGGTVADAADIKLALGDAAGDKGRSIEQMTILGDLGRATITREGGALRLRRGAPQTIEINLPASAVDAVQSFREAGLDARLALEASALVERRAAGARRITAVIAERPDRFEARGVPQLQYLAAALEGQRPVRLLRWPGTPEGWIDVAKFTAQIGFAQPVQGRISSRFGSRLHPILRFLRPHQGVDFAAGWGTPVRAAADGRVIGAGWSGGYGRQVRLDHGNAVLTSYAHLSSMSAVPGGMVKRGQVIGYVGASGLATGPHLHFEVIRRGQRVDPLSTRLLEVNAVDRAAFAARLAQLRIAGA